MKLVGILILIFLVYAYYLWPSVDKQKICLEIAQRETEEIQYNIVAKALSKTTTCNERERVIKNLEDCLGPSSPVVDGILMSIRPLSMNLLSLKSAYHLECEDGN